MEFERKFCSIKWSFAALFASNHGGIWTDFIGNSTELVCLFASNHGGIWTRVEEINTLIEKSLHRTTVEFEPGTKGFYLTAQAGLHRTTVEFEPATPFPPSRRNNVCIEPRWNLNKFFHLSLNCYFQFASNHGGIWTYANVAADQNIFVFASNHGGIWTRVSIDEVIEKYYVCIEPRWNLNSASVISAVVPLEVCIEPRWNLNSSWIRA